MPNRLFEASRLACEEGALKMSLRRSGISDSVMLPFVGIFICNVVDIVVSAMTPGMAKQEDFPVECCEVKKLSTFFSCMYFRSCLSFVLFLALSEQIDN